MYVEFRHTTNTWNTKLWKHCNADFSAEREPVLLYEVITEYSLTHIIYSWLFNWNRKWIYNRRLFQLRKRIHLIANYTTLFFSAEIESYYMIRKLFYYLTFSAEKTNAPDCKTIRLTFSAERESEYVIWKLFYYLTFQWDRKLLYDLKTVLLSDFFTFSCTWL